MTSVEPGRQAQGRTASWFNIVNEWLPTRWGRQSLHVQVEGGESSLAADADDEYSPALAGLLQMDGRAQIQAQDLDKFAVYQRRSLTTQTGSTDFVAVSLCRFPSPDSVSHAELLQLLASQVEKVAQEGAYNAVLFLDPAPHIPALAQLVAAYFSLSYTARKRVACIYLVGGGWRTTLIARIFSLSILSPQTAERGKLRVLSTLSELAVELGGEAFRSLEIPLQVYMANARRDDDLVQDDDESSNSRSADTSGNFLEPDDVQVPPLVRDCLAVLAEQGPASVGIFRRSPSSANVGHLAAAYARGHPVRLDLAPDASYLAASLLKRYLADLSPPICSRAVCETAKRCPLNNDDEAVMFIRENVCSILTPAANERLRSILPVLHVISLKSSHNLMTSFNLVLCICPALVGGISASIEDVEMCRVPGMDCGSMKGLRKETASPRENSIGGVLRVMIDRFDDIFPEDALPAR